MPRGIVCEECKGTGIVVLFTSREECDMCDGAGEILEVEDDDADLGTPFWITSYLNKVRK